MIKMNALRPTLLALALTAAFPVLAQTNAEVLNELRALRDRVADLEKKLQAAEAKAPAANKRKGRPLLMVDLPLSLKDRTAGAPCQGRRPSISRGWRRASTRTRPRSPC